MQYKNNKTLHFTKILGKTAQELRIAKTDKSLNKLEEEYDIPRGSLSRLEKGETDSQISTIWKFSEALNIKFSEFAKKLEENIEENFTFVDE
ncbi:MAG: helix-turn-helix domain-containing protein [Candidatus Gastranaerophilales bacterium]|nr:helix-turn-helix domain-containing protein [Candidatus Gastranaerophilales bacterium]